MLNSKVVRIISVFSVLLISGCSNMHVSLETGKNARRAGDYELAKHHLVPLVEMDIDEAKYELALVKLREKSSNFKDYKEARELLLDVQGKRKPQALFELARIYEKGRGVKRRKSKAKDYYRASAKMGYPRANYALAEILVDEREYKGAMGLCKDAFYDSYERASMCIGNLYENGLGTSRNRKKALSWYLIAQRNNIKGADAKVNKLSARLSPEAVEAAATLSIGLEKNEEN